MADLNTIITDIAPLNVQRPNGMVVIHAKQSDGCSRFYRAEMYDGTEPWTPGTGVSAMLRYKKPDGHFGAYDEMENGEQAITVSNNVVTFGMTEQALNVPGRVLVDLTFYQSVSAEHLKRLSTFNILLDVEPAPVSDEAIVDSKDYVSVLGKGLAAAAALIGMTVSASDAGPIDEGGTADVHVTGGPDEGTVYNFDFELPSGKRGLRGYRVSQVLPDNVSLTPGGVDTYKFKTEDGSDVAGTFQVYNGMNGVGVVNSVDGVQPNGTNVQLNALRVPQGTDAVQALTTEQIAKIRKALGIGSMASYDYILPDGSGVTDNGIIFGDITETQYNTLVTDVQDAKNRLATVETSKMDVRTVVTEAIENSPALITSGGVYDAVDSVAKVSTTEPTEELNRIWVKPTVTEVEIPTMEDFDDLKNSVTERSINIANVLTREQTYNGITVSSNSTDLSVEISGTAISSGDGINYFLKQALTAGTYRLQFFGSTTTNVRFIMRFVGSSSNYHIFEYVSGANSFTGSFTVEVDCEITIAVQAISGTVYNGSFYVQIISGTSAPSSFIPPLTAVDGTIRPIATEALNLANRNASALLSKLDAVYYWGIGKSLAINKNNGENTLNPTLLYPRSNEAHFPGVRVVEDTNSPVADLFGYKHEVYKGTQTGWQSVMNNFIFLEANVESFSFGFWVNIEEVNAVFTNTNYLDLMFLSSSRRFTVRLYLSLMISNVGTTYTLTIPESINLINSATATGVCLATDSGYAYIKFDVEDIVYASDVNATVFENLILYWRFDNVTSGLSNKQITFVGVTALQNDTIESGYYRYPDGNGLTQLPQAEPLYESANEATDKPVTLVYVKDNLEDTRIICNGWDAVIENDMVALYDDASYNRTCRPTACFITVDGVKKQVMKSEDDGCPINFGSGYLAAGHGYARGRKITKSSHGKTYADIGSEWVDSNSKHFYLIRVFDENNIGFMPKGVADNQYDTENNIPTGSLTHVSDAVHTDTISDFTSEMWQIEPIVMANQVKKILLNGFESITESGTYYGDFVDVIDEYDVANPQTIASAIIANKPTGGYTENPDPNVGVSFMHFSNVYRFISDGTLLIFSTIDADVDLYLGYWGGTQYAEKNAANVFGGSCKKYIPATLPVTVSGTAYDMRMPVNMNGWNANLNYASASWEDADYPPDRIVTYYTDVNDVIKAGYAVGYLPIGLGAPSVRKGNVSNALNLYSSKKYYPHLIDSQVISAYTPMQSVVYRKPVINVADKHTSAYFVPCGDKCYLYADYHAVADDRIKVPADYIGKPMTIINKTDNVTVYGTIATDEIRIRCTTASPMYGYAVVQIG